MADSSETTTKTTKMVTLRSSDGETFEVEEKFIVQSQTIKHMIEDDCAENIIPLPNLEAKTVAKVIEYCKKHVSSPSTASASVSFSASSSSSASSSKPSSSTSSDVNEELIQWDKNFMKGLDNSSLFELTLAANYLDIRSLLDLTAQTIADMIKEKSPEEVRKIFNIVNDFTPEEEAAVRKENEWAYE